MWPNGTCTGYAFEQEHEGPQQGHNNDDIDEEEEEEQGQEGEEQDERASRQQAQEAQIAAAFRRTVHSTIRNGTWSLQSMQFEYVYGRHPYQYDVQLVSVVETCRREIKLMNVPQQLPVLPTAHLVGTWGSISSHSNPFTEHGTVDQMLLMGAGLRLSRNVLW